MEEEEEEEENTQCTEALQDVLIDSGTIVNNEVFDVRIELF